MKYNTYLQRAEPQKRDGVQGNHGSAGRGVRFFCRAVSVFGNLIEIK